jgi:hypothetical protein
MSETINWAFLVLLLQLGDPDFHKREQAHLALEALAPVTLQQLTWGAKHRDLEIARRCQIIVDRQYRRIAPLVARKIRPTSYPRVPWISELPQDWPQRFQIGDSYHQRALDHPQGPRPGPPDYNDYRFATVLMMEDLICIEKWTPEKLTKLLDQMVIGEKQWIAEHGKNCLPRIEEPKGPGPAFPPK